MVGMSVRYDVDIFLLQKVQCATFDLTHNAVLGMSRAVLGAFVKREECLTGVHVSFPGP